MSKADVRKLIGIIYSDARKLIGMNKTDVRKLICLCEANVRNRLAWSWSLLRRSTKKSSAILVKKLLFIVM